MNALAASLAFGELLVEDRQVAGAILTHRFDERHVRAAALLSPAAQADALLVFLPGRQIGDELQPEGPTRLEDAMHGRQGRRQIGLAQQRLQDAVWRDYRPERFDSSSGPA